MSPKPSIDQSLNRNDALRKVTDILPGLAVAAVIAAASSALHALPGFTLFSPLILSIFIGMVLRNTFGPIATTQDGIRFAVRRILRTAIVLLGFQFTLAQLE